MLGRLPEVFILVNWHDVVRAFRLGSPSMHGENEWDMKVRTAAAMRILLHGRGSVQPAFIEESGWSMLLENSSPRLQFRDELFSDM